MDEKNLQELQKKLGYCFNDPDLLINSLTHSSYANENTKKGVASNERLEFLGDSLLGIAISLLIYTTKPKLTEGQMTKLRAELVCERSLAELALELDLGSYLILGRGEENGGGRSRPSILSDTFEAVLAALYLDGGFEPLNQFITTCFKQRIDKPTRSVTDFKTLLQELTQVKQGQTLVYEKTNEHGPDHNKSFTVVVKLNGESLGTGVGKTKKHAEQEAAKASISILENSI